MQRSVVDILRNYAWGSWLLGLCSVLAWTLFDDWVVDAAVRIGSVLLSLFVLLQTGADGYRLLKGGQGTRVIGNFALLLLLVFFIRFMFFEIGEISIASKDICGQAHYCLTHECQTESEIGQDALSFSRFFQKTFNVTLGHTTVLISYTQQSGQVGLNATKGVRLSETGACFVLK